MKSTGAEFTVLRGLVILSTYPCSGHARRWIDPRGWEPCLKSAKSGSGVQLTCVCFTCVLPLTVYVYVTFFSWVDISYRTTSGM